MFSVLMKTIIRILSRVVFAMAIFGVVAVASASDKGRYMEFSELIKSIAARQFCYTLVALVVGWFAWRQDYHFYRRPEFMWTVFIATLVLLGLVFAPGIGYEAGGSKRWINTHVAGVKLQPSEFAKIAMMMLTCAWLDRAGSHVRRFREGILIPGLALGAVAGLILLQTDLGATVVLLTACGVVLFAAGVRFWAHLLPIAGAGALVLALVVYCVPYCKKRVEAFTASMQGCEVVEVVDLKFANAAAEELAKNKKILPKKVEASQLGLKNDRVVWYFKKEKELPLDQWEAGSGLLATKIPGLSAEAALDATNIVCILTDRRRAEAREHVEMSKEAFRNGDLTGVGFMRSKYKKYILQEAHTDFIGAIIGEEFGFIGMFLLLCGYGTILVCGIYISARAPDRFGKYLAFGMTFLLTSQAGINLGVITGVLPTTGIALPFMSYGGTSIVASMIAAGVILNVGRKALEAKVSDEANVFRDAAKI